MCIGVSCRFGQNRQPQVAILSDRIQFCGSIFGERGFDPHKEGCHGANPLVKVIPGGQYYAEAYANLVVYFANYLEPHSVAIQALTNFLSAL